MSKSLRDSIKVFICWDNDIINSNSFNENLVNKDSISLIFLFRGRVIIFRNIDGKIFRKKVRLEFGYIDSDKLKVLSKRDLKEYFNDNYIYKRAKPDIGKYFYSPFKKGFDGYGMIKIPSIYLTKNNKLPDYFAGVAYLRFDILTSDISTFFYMFWDIK